MCCDVLQAGASILDGDKYGNTVVHYAALKGQVGTKSHTC